MRATDDCTDALFQVHLRDEQGGGLHNLIIEGHALPVTRNNVLDVRNHVSTLVRARFSNALMAFSESNCQADVLHVTPEISTLVVKDLAKLNRISILSDYSLTHAVC